VAGLNRAVNESTLRELSDVRCTGCRRLLGRMSHEGLRPSKVLEIKCPKCDFFRYVVGESS
jgi:phage FluMu protein Com